MEQSIVFAGFGGQGVLTAGLIVANVAMQEGKDLVLLESNILLYASTLFELIKNFFWFSSN